MTGSAPPTRSPLHTALLAVLLLLGLALTGCSGDGSDSAAGSDEQGDSVAGSAPAEGADSAGTAGEPGTALPLTPEVLDRQIIVTADLTVRSEDVRRDADRARQQVTVLGGQLSGDVRSGTGDDQTADLVLRVPPDEVDRLLTTLSEFGQEVSRSVRSEDVTTVKADIDARVETLQASLDRLRGLIAEASDITDLVSLERELTTRESELESLQAQQRALGDQIGLATVSLHLVAAVEPPVEIDEQTGFLAGLSSGWDAFVRVGTALLTALGAGLPFLGVLALIVAAAVAVSRRRQRTMNTPAAAPPPAG